MPMPMSNAFRFACGARCVDNFDNIVRSDSFYAKFSDSRQMADRIERRTIDRQSCFGFGFDSPYEIFRKTEIDGYRDDPRRDTGPKDGYPFHPILGPDQKAVAFTNAVLLEIVHGGVNCSIHVSGSQR